MPVLNRQTEEAKVYFAGQRGRYVIEKAIYYGIIHMKAMPFHRREDSDIADIEYLRKDLFNVWADELLDGELAEKHFELSKIMGKLETHRSELQEEQQSTSQ